MSLRLYFGPLLEISQTGKEPNNLCSTNLIISVFQLILDSEHKTKTGREIDGKIVCFINYQQKKTPNGGGIARHTVLGSLYYNQPCSADGEKKYVSGAFSLIIQIFLMTEQWIFSAISSYNLLLVWTLYLSWSRPCCMILFKLYSIMKNSILKLFSK